eukprot:TRINITY_DN35995_c0_g1_i2.p1 TRINITY_DN35995_c0_g1~~TRINITY_DN35995_c0_g1_i2.p1  ORF type:complete len:265 (-),score=53.88 TRINITY_DN35995_c0_g1_i2:131-925(-)
MPLAGVLLRYGKREERLPGVFPQQVLECAALAARLFDVWKRLAPLAEEPRWLRLRGEDLDKRSASSSKFRISIDSDDALQIYLQKAGWRRVYAEIEVSVETLVFSALHAPVREHSPVSEHTVALEGDPDGDAVEESLEAAAQKFSNVSAADEATSSAPLSGLRFALEGRPVDVPTHLGSLELSCGEAAGAVGSANSGRGLTPSGAQSPQRLASRLPSTNLPVAAVAAAMAGNARQPSQVERDVLIGKDAVSARVLLDATSLAAR